MHLMLYHLIRCPKRWHDRCVGPVKEDWRLFTILLFRTNSMGGHVGIDIAPLAGCITFIKGQPLLNSYRRSLRYLDEATLLDPQ